MDYERMSKMAFNVHEDEMAVVKAEEKLYDAKRKAIDLKDQLGLETSRATLAALTEGRIVGKNAEMRAAELEVLLADNVLIKTLREQVRGAENMISAAEYTLGYNKAALHYSKSLLEAAMVTVKTAEPVAVIVPHLQDERVEAVAVQRTPEPDKSPFWQTPAAYSGPRRLFKGQDKGEEVF